MTEVPHGAELMVIDPSSWDRWLAAQRHARRWWVWYLVDRPGMSFDEFAERCFLDHGLDLEA